MPTSKRAFFESRFGTDFSSVKIHADSNANQLARSINAKAFTHGRDVVFGAGQYSLETPEGNQLLAHELTHVVQQQHFITSTGFVQRDETDELMLDLGIDIRNFDELWREFERQRDAGEDEQALQLVRPILVRIFLPHRNNPALAHLFPAGGGPL